MAAKIPIIATTINNSIKVNAFLFMTLLPFVLMREYSKPPIKSRIIIE